MYPNRELLILNSGVPVEDLLPDDLRIRLIEVQSATIGELRNTAVRLAHGEIIAHWDDDDYSAPDRLMDQVVRMHKTKAMVTGYCEMLFESPSERWMFSSVANFAIGTSLMYRKDWALSHPFPAVQVAEDAAFSNYAREQKVLTTAPARDLMRASIHAGNTSPRRLKGDNWKQLGAVA